MVARALLARAHSSHQPAWCGNTLVAEGRPVVTREPHDGHHVTPENSSGGQDPLAPDVLV